MDYRGPQPADYDNVRALNLAFLKLLGDRERTGRWFRRLPDTLFERAASLTALERERLASAPFLLFSCREGDAEHWEWLLDVGRSENLLEPAANRDPAETGVVAAALGFMWQLARQNPYAARLICGASLHWCEQLAERPLLDVVSAAASGNVLELRNAADAELWNKLLYTGTIDIRPIAEAARISAMQRVLTYATGVRPVPAAMAASRLHAPTLRVAEEIDR